MKKIVNMLGLALILVIEFLSLGNLTTVQAKVSRNNRSSHYVRSHTRKIRTRASNGVTYTRSVGVRGHYRSR